MQNNYLSEQKMDITFLKHRWAKILLIVVGVLSVLLLLAALLIDSYFTPRLSEKLKTAVASNTDSLYTINFSKIELHILQGKVVINDLEIKADSAVYKHLKQNKKAPNNLYQLQVKQLVIADVHFLALYFKKKLEIGRIALITPEVASSQYANQDNKVVDKDKTLYEKIKKSLKLIHVNEISLTGANYKHNNYTAAKPTLTELKQLDLKATDLLIDSATQTDTSRLLYCKNIITDLKNYSSKSADGLYTFKVKSVKLSTQTKKLTITGIDLKPVNQTLFFKKSKSDSFTLRIDSVQFNNFDYMAYQKTQNLDVKQLVMHKGYFEVCSNYNGPLQTTDRLVTFPHWAIRHAIKTTLNIDTLDMKHMNVVYSQLDKTSKKFGHLKFDNITGRFLNLTNRADKLKKNNTATANLTSYFMGKAKLDLHFVFNLTDATYNYAYKGHLASMNMSDVNPVLMPLSMVKITEGRLNSFDFNVHSTQKLSKGTVSFLYHGLKVDVLRPDYTKKTLISTLANAVILKHDNPDNGDNKPRIANVVYIRPANFPFFKTVWHVLLNGIKNCAGVGPAQEKKLSQQTDTDDKKEQEKIVKKAVKEKEKEDKKFKEKVKEKKEGKKDQ
jgi:hypothetical protein